MSGPNITAPASDTFSNGQADGQVSAEAVIGHLQATIGALNVQLAVKDAVIDLLRQRSEAVVGTNRTAGTPATPATPGATDPPR